MTIILFFAVLFVLILVHEWGHFIVAKKTGMRVDEFGIGFPPKLFGYTWRGTEYTLNIFPIGGFVRIFGEDGIKTTSAGAQFQHENITDTQAISSDSFASKSRWAQAAVLVAGVAMSILLAWVLFVCVFVFGAPTAVEEGKQSPEARLVVTHVSKNSPAEEAGIRVGSEIISFGSGEQKLLPSSFAAYTKEGEAAKLVVVRTREGEQTLSITPRAGVVEGAPEAKAIGVALALTDAIQKQLTTALVEATITTITSLKLITVGLLGLIVDIFQNDADLSQVAGPIGIVGLVGEAAEFGLASLLLFTAMISLNLAVINLLPFPALDGGRLVFVALEAIMKRPINPIWTARINTAGFVLLLVLMVAVSYSDILKKW